MSKIYVRNNLVKKKPKKKKDEKARVRNIIVNFRMAPEEKQILDNRIQLAGISKQDYLIQSSLYHQVITYGNIKVFDEIKRQLLRIEEHLESIPVELEVDIEVIESFRMIAEIIAGLELQDKDIVNQSKSKTGIYYENSEGGEA